MQEHEPQSPMTYALDIRDLSKTFDQTPAVTDATVSVEAGQLTALLGPSGCGKTTLLRLIAGFEWPDRGTITIKGRLVAGGGQRIAPEARNVGMVFQEYALFPHLTVNENVAFGLRGAAAAKHARVAEMLALVGLSAFGTRLPNELSGGQQQRVALARALAPKPDALLLDEPFSNLDAALRTQVRHEVRTILSSAGTTAVFVTHDQEEALSLADQVAVMFDGRVVQVAPPQRMYLEPNSRAVAAFVGEANFLPGEAQGDFVRCALGALPCLVPSMGKVDVLVRPESLHVTQGDPPNDATTAQIMWREFYGHDQRLGMRLPDGTTLVARTDAHRRFEIGAWVSIHVTAAVRVFEQR
jgi:iron(III) transport system ATP-binding protein